MYSRNFLLSSLKWPQVSSWIYCWVLYLQYCSFLAPAWFLWGNFAERFFILSRFLGFSFTLANLNSASKVLMGFLSGLRRLSSEFGHRESIVWIYLFARNITSIGRSFPEDVDRLVIHGNRLLCCWRICLWSASNGKLSFQLDFLLNRLIWC